jgi:hypothetical protein
VPSPSVFQHYELGYWLPRPLTRSKRKTTTNPASTKPHKKSVPQPPPVSVISSTGVEVDVAALSGSGVAEGVPGPGVSVKVGVMLGV